MNNSQSRRKFIKNCTLATATIPLSSPIFSAHGFKTSKKVIVIGAGLAGLVCAYELGETGYDVSVLEAQAQVGGRVKTVRTPFKNGQYAEVGGASFYPIEIDIAKGYIEKFNLKIATSQVGKSLSDLTFFKDQKKLSLEFPLTEEEIEMGVNGMKEKYLSSAADELWASIRNGNIAETEKKYDRLSFADLMYRNGASPEAVRLITTINQDYVGEGAEWYSAADMIGQSYNVAEQAGTYKDRFYSIDGGNDLLPKAFAKNLKGALQLNSHVKQVRKVENGFEVTFLKEGEKVKTDADFVVVAIPPGPTNNIIFEPALPKAKADAISNAKMASVSRVFYQTSSRIWEEQGLSGSALTDLPIRYFMDSTKGQTGGSGIIQGYMIGQSARHFQNLDNDQKKTYTLKQFEKLFAGISKQIIATHWEIWDANPFAQGAYLYFQPGQMESVFPYLSKKEGRILFAGSHSASRLLHSSMQGALESGLKAAKEITNFNN
jgi:monoamine oxidase